MGNATANASASTANALVSLICQCNSTGSWCRGVGNASNGTSRVSARAYVSCRLNYSNYIEESSKHLSEYIHSNYNRVVYILTLAICSLFLMVFLICLSPFRRHSRNRFLAAALWASQALPFTIIAHTLGLMQSPPYQNQPYAIWAALCLLIHGISSSRLYGIHDLQLEKKQIFQEGALLYLAAWSMYLHRPEAKLRKPLLSILGAVALKFVFRLLQTGLIYWRSCRFFGLRRRVKLVADFMSFEHELSRPVKPISMTGYNYLVKGEENVVKLMANKESYDKNSEKISKKAVTVERIWQCEGGLLQGREDLKDKCLSFALFRLLAMRLRGFPLHKEHLSKTWDLVQYGLLSEQNKHERAFRVIEDELSFLYDYFYTQYPLLFSDGKFFAARTAIYAFLELVQFLASLWIIVVLSKEFNGGFGTHDRELYRFCQAQNGTWSRFLDFDCSHVADDIHFLGACIFVVVYVVLRILQLVAIVFSNWTKVWLICEYVERPWLQGNRTLESLIGFVCGCKVIPFKPWRRKMSQYSLLSSYNYRPIFKFLTSALFTLPNRGQEIQDSKKLDLYVEGAVLDALKDNGLQLTNGLSSLERNQVDSQLFSEFRLESITDTILVWHVATSFCALHQKYGGASEGEESACECLSRWCCAHLLDCGESKEEQESAPGKEKQNREVAECLSGYCAYLVAFVPALLPDPTDAAEVAFDQAILDARELLGKCRDLRGVYRELRKVGEKEVALTALGKKNRADGGVKAVEVGGFSEKVVVAMGAKLGMQLLSKVGNDDEARLWKVLVDFWTEMMLFLAPSNNEMAHAESLANGGEFITHLWALLTHVGGCRQDSDNSHTVCDDNAVAKSQQVGSQASGPGNEGTFDSQDIQDGTANYGC
ncbi:hypothetical protein ACLOJK_028961 [Asimina triloba]